MNQKLELQILSTGHFAPWGYNDIAENNRLSGKFPHCPIAHLAPLDKIEAGRTVIDAGAFIGDNTLEFLEKGWKVIAFEPFFDAYVCARLNAPSATVIIGAVGDGRRASLNYECPGTNFGMRSVVKAENGTPTIRIDDLGLEDCAFIKLDVEGMEMAVLEGAKKTIMRCRPVMLVELNDGCLNRFGQTKQTIIKMVEDFNYRMELATPQYGLDVTAIDVLFIPN